jgi:MoxR-like ATPase
MMSDTTTTASRADEDLHVSDKHADWFSKQFEVLTASIERVIVGKRETVRLALVALFAEGHLLVEDVPGTGKTSLAKALANSIDGRWTRIQFTPDLLPADVTGSTVYNQSKGTFEFHPGPVFSNIVLGDEINRASPKTQSALLEVMEEHQVTIDSQPYPVPRPFMVIATQNPIEFEGTYRLPEAQLDRFLMKISVGYLDAAAEVDVLTRHGKPSEGSSDIAPVMAGNHVRTMVEIAERVFVEPSIANYIVTIAQATRSLSEIRLGVSTRGCLALMRAARVYAVANGRPFVRPDDVRALVPAVFEHRIMLTPEAEMRGVRGVDLLNQLLNDIPTPRRRSE